MKVVIATNDNKMLNGHFALSRSFMFYDIEEEVSEFVREVTFEPEEGEGSYPGCSPRKPFRVEERLEAVKGNDVVFVAAIGAPIAERVLENDVYPMEMNAPEAIDDILSKLQVLLKDNPPLWLRRILNHDFMSERIEE